MSELAEPLELWYDALQIGYVHGAFVSDDAWFGTTDLRIRPDEGEQQQRILQFIAFNEQWNERARTEGADATEFERFPELIRSGKWHVKTRDGRIDRILDAPVFFAGNEITWRVEKT